MTLILSIGCRKGGVGKTALCASMASYFTYQKKKVLIIDLDSQGNVTFGLGGEPGGEGSAEFLKGKAISPLELHPNLFLFQGGPELNSIEINRLDPEGLQDRIQMSQFDFDVILIDLPPYSEHLERLGLVASDASLIPVVAHPFAISGAARIIELIEARKAHNRPGPKQYALIRSMTDLRRSLDRSLDESLEELFPNTPRFNFRQDISVAYALTDQIPLHQFDRRAKVITDLNLIGDWLNGTL